jgi:AraC-like DNA-binding protein
VHGFRGKPRFIGFLPLFESMLALRRHASRRGEGKPGMTEMLAVPYPVMPRFKTTDAAEAREYIKDSTGTHKFDMSRSSHFVDFVHHDCSVGRVSMHFCNLNATDGFRITKTGAAPYYSFQFLMEGTCNLEGSFGSVVVNPGEFFVIDPDSDIRETWPRNCLQFIVRVDRPVIEQLVSDELSRKLTKHVVFDPFGRDPGITGWLRHIANVMWMNGNEAALLSDRHVSKNVERSLTTMLVAGLHHSESEEFNRQGGAAPYYVKRAEAHIREQAGEELTVDDIAAVAGVSPRSLFYGFKRWRNTTPMAYVRDVRLDIARQALEKARVTGGTVSEAAMNAGFTNFSQFSKIYKARFGETPSATLKVG